MAYIIRSGSRDDCAVLPAIERAAGARFADIGMPEIAAGGVTPLAVLHERAQGGRLFVAERVGGGLAGFLIWSPADGDAYIEEVSVHPHDAGHRLAAQLIDATAVAAAATGARWLTLATFRNVPWNAPYYVRLGFAAFTAGEGQGDHQVIWRQQQEAGLDMSRRVFMRRALAPRV